MKSETNPISAQAETADGRDFRTQYLDALQMLERLHRRLLDVLKDEFDRQERDDVNPVQALLLFNIGDGELTAGELRSKGYYLGSNVSYNIKRLTQAGFINSDQAPGDRRSVKISLTEQGLEVAGAVSDLYDKHLESIETVGGITRQELESMNRTMSRMDRFWTDSILYRI